MSYQDDLLDFARRNFGAAPGPIVNLVGGVSSKGTLRRWRKARSRVLGGLGNATVVCLGNSLTAGAGGVLGNSSLGGNAKAKAWPTVLAKQLTACGLNASWQSWMGGQGNLPDLGAPTWTDYDARIQMGSAQNAGFDTLGSNVLQISNGSPIVFTPLTPVNKLVLYALKTGATFNVSVDGGATLATFAAGASSGTYNTGRSQLIDLGTTATHAIMVNAQNTGFLCGMVPYNSAVSEVTIIGAGSFGTTADLMGRPLGTQWCALDTLAMIAPDLTIVALSFNDIAATTLDNYKLDMQRIISCAQLTGDVVLAMEQYGGGTTDAAAAPFRAALQTLSSQYGCPFVDISAIWGNDYSAYSDVYGSGDGVHCTAAGYADIAGIYREVLLAA